ncbi:Gfo/Idh/MocA family protein [Paenibacillus koleovorans]|uniref:Gfo/Idh/MocA family protein n=1 Tax=Paenibacillus koleovorans TaxID=121608 RepID=UPI000FDB7989|nr:Gfo/Idh/MocA family oxidoreductase [Paenibacillus koleovorans]
MTQNQRKFGIGLIGCGSISRHHIEGCAGLADECEIRAVSDLVPEKANTAAASIGANVQAYTDYTQLLSRPDIDVVAICSPPFAHKVPVIDALRAGKHVICEKPMAASLQDCDEMIAVARDSGRKLSIVFQLRFDPDIQRIRRVLQSPEMEPVVFAQMNGYYWRGSNYYNVPWRGKFDTECGGVTMNHSIHTVDLFLWLMNDQPISVSAEMDTIGHDIEVEDISMAVIKFSRGAMAQLNCSLVTVRQEHTMEFSGATKQVSFPLNFHAVQQDAGGFPVRDDRAIECLWQLSDMQEATAPKHKYSYADLFRAIREDSEPLVNGEEGRKTIELITAIYKSATTGTKVLLPLERDDPWYTRTGMLEHVKRREPELLATESIPPHIPHL